jgi:hypothetical protein
MQSRLARAHRAVSVTLAIFALAGSGILFIWEALPGRFPGTVHGFLAALPLAMIAVAYLVYQGAGQRPVREWIKTAVLVTAFLFWAANQLWPDLRQAIIFNDIAIGLFIVDVFLVIISRSPVARVESGQMHARQSRQIGARGSSSSFVTKA